MVKNAGGDWRDKYRRTSLGGRQQTCEFLADQWYTVVKAMEGQLAAIGVKPLLIPADALLPTMVLTLDQVLPEMVNLSPPQIALIGTTGIIAQRWYHRKAIATALAAIGKPAPSSMPTAPLPIPTPASEPETAPPPPMSAPVAVEPTEPVLPFSPPLDMHNEYGELVI